MKTVIILIVILALIFPKSINSQISNTKSLKILPQVYDLVVL
jgi:hypothetical protein